jgi:hypothetical protein
MMKTSNLAANLRDSWSFVLFKKSSIAINQYAALAAYHYSLTMSIDLA